jgi:hypothetical protein
VKRILLIGMILLFMVQASIKTVILIDWKIYQKEITEQYCINKDKPEMQCNGQCYLAKKMRAITNEYEASKSSYPPINTKGLELQLFFEHPSISFHLASMINEKERVSFCHLIQKTTDFNQQILQPPQRFLSFHSAS